MLDGCIDRPLCYFCPCLNVQLHRVSTDVEIDNVVDEDDNLNLNYGDPFFVNAVNVSPEGFQVSKKVECLCNTRPVADKWLVTSCLNCRVETHAVSRNGQGRSCRIYVSRKMNTDASTASTLSQSDDYSRVFEIVVRPFMANEGQSIAFGIVDELATNKRSEELKRMASAFIDAEKESMKGKISDYKKLQLFNLKQLESRVQQDRNILIQRIASDIQDGGGQLSPFQHAVQARPSSASATTAGKTHTTAKPSTAKSGAMAMLFSRNKASFDVFAMDEDDVFSPSEPENGSTSDEDECPSYDAPLSSPSVTSDARLFATSLPVSMPIAPWKGPSVVETRRLVEDDGESHPTNISSDQDKDNFQTEDPEWMAASIKALYAMSVRGDDSADLFGARPRPRLNTLD